MRGVVVVLEGDVSDETDLEEMMATGICAESMEVPWGSIWCARVSGHASAHCGALMYVAGGLTVVATVWGTREQLAELIGEGRTQSTAETAEATDG